MTGSEGRQVGGRIQPLGFALGKDPLPLRRNLRTSGELRPHKKWEEPSVEPRPREQFRLWREAETQSAGLVTAFVRLTSVTSCCCCLVAKLRLTVL